MPTLHIMSTPNPEASGFPYPHCHSFSDAPLLPNIDVVVTGFVDKIMVLIYTNARISRLFYVPLLASPVSYEHTISFDEDYDGMENNMVDDDFMPLPHLTPMSLLGGDDSLGNIYAVQIASMISRQSPEDRRMVIVGIGPELGTNSNEGNITLHHRKQYLEVMKLVQTSRVW